MAAAMAEGANVEPVKKGQKRTRWEPTVEIKVESEDDVSLEVVPEDGVSSALNAAVEENQIELLTAIRTTEVKRFERSKRAYVAAELAYCSQVLIGLDHLVEVPCQRVICEPAYYCKICIEVFPAHGVIDHVTSTPHRKAFLVLKASPTEMQTGWPSMLNGLKDQSAIDEAVTAAAVRYERTHGRCSILHIFAKPFKPKLLGQARFMPADRLGDTTIQQRYTLEASRVKASSHAAIEEICPDLRLPTAEQLDTIFRKELAAAPTKPFEKWERCFFHDELATFPQPLVGLERIVELGCAQKDFYPAFYCKCCEVVLRLGPFSNLTKHLTSVRHTKLYLDSVKPLDFHVASLLAKANVSTLWVDFAVAAKKFEEKYGRQQVLWRSVGEFDNGLLRTPKIKAPKRPPHPANTAKVPEVAKAAPWGPPAVPPRASAPLPPVPLPPAPVPSNGPPDSGSTLVPGSQPKPISRKAAKKRRKKEREKQKALEADARITPAVPPPKKKSAPIAPIAPDYFDLQGNIAISPNLARPWSTPTHPPTLPPPNLGPPPDFPHHFYNSPHGMPVGPGPSWCPEQAWAAGPSWAQPSLGPLPFSAAAGPSGADFSKAQLRSWPGWHLGSFGPSPAIAGPCTRGTVFDGPVTGDPEWFTGVLPTCSTNAGSEAGGTAGTSTSNVDALKAGPGEAWNQLRHLMAGQKSGSYLPPADTAREETVGTQADLLIKQEIKEEPLSEDERSESVCDSTSSSEREGTNDDDYADWAAYNEWLGEQSDKTEATMPLLMEAAMSSSQTPAATQKNDEVETLAKRARLTAFALSNFDTSAALNNIATSSNPSHLIHSDSLKLCDILPAGTGGFNRRRQEDESLTDKGLDQFMALLSSLQGGSTSNYSAGEGLPGLLDPSGSGLSGPVVSGWVAPGPFPGSTEGVHFSSSRPDDISVHAASQIGSVGAKLSRDDLLRMLLEEKQLVAEQAQVIKSLAKRIGS